MNEDTQNVELLNTELESQGAENRLAKALELFDGEIFLSTSFGIQSAVMLHMCVTAKPEIPVVWVDTGYLFPETYRFANELIERLNLNIKIYTPRTTAAYQEALFGKRWQDGKAGIEAYNRVNKVEPMNRAATDLKAKAWITGLRRSQSSTREGLDVFLRQNKIVKVHPIVDWSNKDVYEYLMKYDLPYHPLWDKGYVSVGDWHSTTRLADAGSEEATRFGGVKRECGLHELSGDANFQI